MNARIEYSNVADLIDYECTRTLIRQSQNVRRLKFLLKSYGMIAEV